VTRITWEETLVPPRTDDDAWEVFHENSKTGRYSDVQPSEAVLQRMQELSESLAYEQYPEIELPTTLAPLRLTLAEAITTRVTARALESCALSLEELATLLHYAYGVTRTNIGTVFPRPFRTVPSGGALYPLELFVHSAHVRDLEPGLYHYSPTRNNLCLLHYGSLAHRICEAVVQSELLVNASLVLFITAMFERSVFKYGNRGYRFVLLEAGHVAQNVNLVANALGLGCVNVGGYFDREVDELLGLDGVTHSTIYLAGVGRAVLPPEERPEPV
jgi:SagB-type dehydrogenase family enzyme